jgi:hypothetical protein
VQVEGSTLFFSLSILIRVFIAFGESAMTPACYTLAAQQVGENHQVRRIIIFSGTSDLQEFCSKKLQFYSLSEHQNSLFCLSDVPVPSSSRSTGPAIPKTVSQGFNGNRLPVPYYATLVALHCFFE